MAGLQIILPIPQRYQSQGASTRSPPFLSGHFLVFLPTRKNCPSTPTAPELPRPVSHSVAPTSAGGHPLFPSPATWVPTCLSRKRATALQTGHVIPATGWLAPPPPGQLLSGRGSERRPSSRLCADHRRMLSNPWPQRQTREGAEENQQTLEQKARPRQVRHTRSSQPDVGGSQSEAQRAVRTARGGERRAPDR